MVKNSDVNLKVPKEIHIIFLNKHFVLNTFQFTEKLQR